jgi:glycosyltransferase involved in cell wall biosynthesis
MIFFDVTKTAAAGHRSGLTRVSSRLRESLGSNATEVRWDPRQQTFRWAKGLTPSHATDWLLTPELFSEEERPGLTEFLRTRPCRVAAIFHDAIPLKHPHITWPQSVARQPGYMKLLASFDRIWAVSQASRDELIGFWQWQGIDRTPPVDILPLGADFNSQPRVTTRPPFSVLRLLTTGILEPRKNQSFLLEVCADLWSEGLAFELHVVGRVNPHFGQPIVAQIKSLRGKYSRSLEFHEAAADSTLARLYATARATVFPTIAEGCGLPLLESLWMGVPCVCSDLPVLRENASAGGCLPVTPADHAAWKNALRAILTDNALHARLVTEATSRSLPTWVDAAQVLTAALTR